MITCAGIALTAVGGGVRARCEHALVGAGRPRKPSSRRPRVAAEHCDPVTDQRGSKEYKRHVVGVLTERVLTRAARAGTTDMREV